MFLHADTHLPPHYLDSMGTALGRGSRLGQVQGRELAWGCWRTIHAEVSPGGVQGGRGQGRGL